MILLDSSYGFEENKVLFVKIGARFPDICLLGPIGPNVVSRPEPHSHELF